MSGYIYAIECGERIKIGFSKKPEERFSKIASDAPFPCVFLGYWPGTVADELDVHAKFQAIRSHGEWFAATEELLRFISAHIVTAAPTSKRFVVKDGDSPLTAWRKNSGLRQADVAALIGCATSYVCQLESGSRGVRLETALKIVKMTDGAVPLESLLTTKEAGK